MKKKGNPNRAPKKRRSGYEGVNRKIEKEGKADVDRLKRLSENEPKFKLLHGKL